MRISNDPLEEVGVDARKAVLWTVLTLLLLFVYGIVFPRQVALVGMIGAFCGWKGAVFSIFGGAIVGTAWFALAVLWQKLSGRKIDVDSCSLRRTPSETTACSGVFFGAAGSKGTRIAS